jgi:hypothetical protein
MDSVIRPVTQSLMYGHPLTGDCMHEFSRAMNRGNAPVCAPALVEAPQGAMLAAGALGAFFLVLLAYGLVLLAMYLYHATMAAWSWVSLLYFMAKSLFEVKALVVPGRKVMVAAGHTLAAAVVDVFAVMGPAVVIAIVNAITNGEPTFSVALYIPAVVVLFFLSRQVTGAVLRKTGVMQGSPDSFLSRMLNQMMAPRSMFGDGAIARRRETAAEIASLTSRSASHLTMFPGAAMLAAGASAVENKLRPGNAGGQKKEAARVPALSDSDCETIDGAIDVIIVGAGRERTTETVTWPPAALPASPAGSEPGSADTVAVDNSGAAADPVIESAPSSPGRRREAAVDNCDDNVDVSSPVVFGGLGPHRLPPEPVQIDETAVAAVDSHPSAGIGDALTADRDRARNIRARSAALFADLGSANRGANSDGDSVDELLSPMVRPYAVPRLRVPALISSTDAAVQRSGREAVRSSASAAVKRERARYVLAASGKNTVPVSADGDPGMRVYMYNDGTRNVVDPSAGEYVMGQRI